MFYEEYDIPSIIEDLKLKMRIPTWEIELLLVTEKEMQDHIGEFTRGSYSATRSISHCFIRINKENELNNKDNGWFLALVHELYHIVVDEFWFQAEVNLDFITSDSLRSRFKETNIVLYERLVDNLSKGLLSIISKEEYLAKFRRDSIDETEDAK